MVEKIAKLIEEHNKNIAFDDLLHKYWYKGKEVISTTQLLRKHNISPDYSMVNTQVLKRASDRGTLIHEDIEKRIKLGYLHELTTSEADVYFDMLAEKNLTPLFAEFFVGNEIVCGECDTILYNSTTNELFIDDHKTGTTIHEEAVRWQGSIYAYLLGIYDDVKGVYCSHLAKTKCEMVLLKKIPKDKIEKLLECEKNGEIYSEEEPMVLTNIDITPVKQLEYQILDLKSRLKELQEAQDTFKKGILEEMQQRGLKKVTIGDISFTVVASSVRRTLNTTKLKEEMPEVAEKYMQEQLVNESLRITIGGTKNGTN